MKDNSIDNTISMEPETARKPRKRKAAGSPAAAAAEGQEAVGLNT